MRIRPAPTSRPDDFYRAPRLIAPPVSTQFYIDTDRGTIQLELAVLDAPLTVDNFVDAGPARVSSTASASTASCRTS